MLSNVSLSRTIGERVIDDLCAHGFVRNEPWVPGNVAGAEEMFGDKMLKISACIIAAVHPSGLDLLKQAPVLALCGHQGALDERLNRSDLASDFSRRLRLLPRLRDLLDSFKVPKQLRDIHPKAWTDRHRELLPEFAAMNPSTLAQGIPPDPSHQVMWLEMCNVFVDRIRMRGDRNRQGPIPHFTWIATRTAPHAHHSATVVGEIADYIISNPGKFNERWSVERAREVVAEWHEELAVLNVATSFGHQFHRHFDAPISYAPFLGMSMRDFYEIVPLDTGRKLYDEGREMKHCVASYAEDVIKGVSRIFSVRKAGTRVATFELRCGHSTDYGARNDPKQWRPIQLQGPKNRYPAVEIEKIVNEWLECHRRQICFAKPNGGFETVQATTHTHAKEPYSITALVVGSFPAHQRPLWRQEYYVDDIVREEPIPPELRDRVNAFYEGAVRQVFVGVDPAHQADATALTVQHVEAAMRAVARR